MTVVMSVTDRGAERHVQIEIADKDVALDRSELMRRYFEPAIVCLFPQDDKFREMTEGLRAAKAQG